MDTKEIKAMQEKIDTLQEPHKLLEMARQLYKLKTPVTDSLALRALQNYYILRRKIKAEEMEEARS